VSTAADPAVPAGRAVAARAAAALRSEAGLARLALAIGALHVVDDNFLQPQPGTSAADPNTFGWRGTRDLHAAVEYLQGRPDVDADRIGALGLSVGGELLLQAAAETDALRAIVSEGAGVRSVREAVHLEGTDKLAATAIFGIATLGTMVWASDLPPRDLEDLSAEISEPVLFVHATPGEGGESLTTRYHAAARGPKELWAAPGGHTGAIDAAPGEYERRVVGFFDRTLGVRRG
jgi:dienelactone hydrolase